MSLVTYKTKEVESVKIFYREAGSPDLPSLLLLHGHGSSSHVFRDLIPLLTSSFHVVAPDYPGFGQSDMPAREKYAYTFANMANTIDKFTEIIGLASKKFAIYIFDYGAPIGLHIASKHPERITGILSQSGNAYEDGLSPTGFVPLRAYWAEPDSPAPREALHGFFSAETIKWSYNLGVDQTEVINPDGGVLDLYYNSRPGALDIQLDLLLDYRNVVKCYPAWQSYLRQHRPKLVAIWGDQDPFFVPAGANAFKRDVPDADVVIVQAGHYLNDFIPGQVAEAVKKLL